MKSEVMSVMYTYCSPVEGATSTSMPSMWLPARLGYSNSAAQLLVGAWKEYTRRLLSLPPYHKPSSSPKPKNEIGRLVVGCTTTWVALVLIIHSEMLPSCAGPNDKIRSESA